MAALPACNAESLERGTAWEQVGAYGFGYKLWEWVPTGETATVDGDREPPGS